MNARITNGQNGAVYIGGTSSTTPTSPAASWCAIQVLADAKFHTLTGNHTGGMANTTSGSAATVPAGVILYGSFTAIQLHSGGVIAYAG